IPIILQTTLTADAVSFFLWSFYWMVLYPAYFTPFLHLPTPKNRGIITGNENGLFTEFPWDVACRFYDKVPNQGLIRYYVALSNERILVTSPQGLSEILSSKSYDFGKSNLSKFAIKRFTGNGLGFLDGDEHKVGSLRKSLMPAFTARHIQDLIPTFWSKAVEMTHGIEETVRLNPTGEAVVALHDWGTRATLDIIGVAGLGYNFDTLNHPDNELSRQYKKMFIEPSNAFNWLELLGNYIDFRFLLKLPIKKNLELTQGSNFMRNIAAQVIRERQEKLHVSGDSGLKDIITTALASGAFTNDQLVDHVMTFLVAGHESTATAFEWTMYELGQRPDIQSRLRREIRDRMPSSLDTANPLLVETLPYLNAVCSEVLRFHPFVPFATRVAEKDTTVLGQHIPKGTILAYAAEATNHDEKLWGPSGGRFDPERFMAPGAANSGGAISNFAFLTFSAGPKSCIGQKFTRTELACLVAAVVGVFEIRLVNNLTAGNLKLGKTKKSKEGIFAIMKRLDGW
ncbi:cytochrome P450 monooxygenase, partial [Apiospora kogelbergensis]|uniref:cytochrome P450 monooxygenase n=1 Tax=Apiospora kogelbergensis TaxID=1337665 RepID=UPI00312CCF18